MPAAEQRARARALNDGKGSSGVNKRLLDMERKSWEEIADIADHVCDVAGVVNQGSITGAGTLTMSLGVPIEYAHDALEATIAGRAGALFIRIYVVTVESMSRARDDDDADAE